MTADDENAVVPDAGDSEEDDDRLDEEDDDRLDEEEDDDRLDEEDLELINENLREQEEEAAVRQFRRLKRAGVGSSSEDEDPPHRRPGSLFDYEEEGRDEEQEVEEYEQYDEGSAFFTVNQQNHLRDIFGSDLQSLMDILSGRRPRTLTTKDDYEDYNAVTVSAPRAVDSAKTPELDEPERLLERYKHRPRPVTEECLNQEAEWIVSRLRDISESHPITIQKAVEIQCKDKLQRLQENAAILRVSSLYTTFPINELFNEKLQRARFREIFKQSAEDFESLHEEMVNKVQMVLEFLLNERLEPSPINWHRGHLLFPPLTPETVWLIYELDVQWWRLRELKRTLLTNTTAMTPKLKSVLKAAESETIIQDFKHYLQTATSSTEPTGDNNTRKRRAGPQSEASLFKKYFIQSGLRNKWSKYLMDVAKLVENLAGASLDDVDMELDEDDEDNAHNNPPEPPENMSQQFKDISQWLVHLYEEGKTDSLPVNWDKLIEGLSRYEGKILSSYPPFRNLIREWLMPRICISTVTTSKGEREIDPINPNWLSLRLYRKPLDDLLNPIQDLHSVPPAQLDDFIECQEPHEKWRKQIFIESILHQPREIALEILKAEQCDQVHLVIHPLSSGEMAPWRNDQDGSDPMRWKRGRKFKRNAAESEDGYGREYEAFLNSDRDDEIVLESLISKILKFYCPRTNCPRIWRNLLTDIVKNAVIKDLLPVIRKETRLKLISASEEYVTRRCEQELLWRLSLKSYDDEWPDFSYLDDDEDEILDPEEVEDYKPTAQDSRLDHDIPVYKSPATISLFVERDQPNPKTYLAIVNRFGVAIDFKVFDPSLFQFIQSGPAASSHTPSPIHIQFEKIFLNKKTRPNLVLIGANGQNAKVLHSYVTWIQSRIKAPKYRFKLHWISLEIPALYAQAPSCPTDVRENHGILAANGLGAALLVQDPLVVIAALWSSAPNLLLSVRLHHLQDLLDKERLESRLLCVLVRVVNDIGIFINRLRINKNQRHMLEFVAGFGPKLSQQFLASFHAPILSRYSILRDEDEDSRDAEGPLVSQCIFKNCCSFLKIKSGEEYGLDKYDQLDPLDNSRIHPIESGNQAQKMCKDAQDEADPNTYVHTTFKNPESLEELDLEAYAIILLKQGKPRMLPQLEFIKREVESPYKDPRFPYQEPASEMVFYQLISEHPTTFKQGSVVNCKTKVIRSGEGRPQRKWFTEPTSIPTRIADEQSFLRQRRGDRNSPDEMSPDTLIKARICDIDYANVELSVLTTENSIRELLEDLL